MLSRILKKRRAVNLQSREYKLLPPVQRTIGQFLLIVKLNTLLMYIPGFKHVPILFSYMCMRKLVQECSWTLFMVENKLEIA